MARRSVKDDKNIYQKLREAQGYSRARASELLQCVSESRLNRIESGETVPYPGEIIAMSQIYGEPNLPNIYCANDCPLGKEYVTQVEYKPLPVITLEVLNLLNNLTKQKDRLIEITVDGTISSDEINDFKEIRKRLEQMSMAIDSMQLWLDMFGSGETNLVVSGDNDQK